MEKHERFEEGVRHYVAGRYNDAVNAFIRGMPISLNKGPDNFRLWLARSHQKLGNYRRAAAAYRDAISFSNPDAAKNSEERAAAQEGRLTCLLHLENFESAYKASCDFQLSATGTASLLVRLAESQLSLRMSKDAAEAPFSVESCVWCLSTATSISESLVIAEQASRCASRIMNQTSLYNSLGDKSKTVIKLLAENVDNLTVMSSADIEATRVIGRHTEAPGHHVVPPVIGDPPGIMASQLRAKSSSGIYEEDLVKKFYEVDPVGLRNVLSQAIASAAREHELGLYSRSLGICRVAIRLVDFLRSRGHSDEECFPGGEGSRNSQQQFFNLILENLSRSPGVFSEQQVLDFIYWSLCDLPELIVNGPYVNPSWQRIPPTLRIRCLRESQVLNRTYEVLASLCSELREIDRRDELEPLYREMYSSFREQMDELDFEAFAFVLEEAGKTAEAEELFWQAALLFPPRDNKMSWEELADFYERHGRGDDAERCRFVLRAIEERGSQNLSEATSDPPAWLPPAVQDGDGVVLGNDEDLNRVMLQHGVEPDSLDDIQDGSAYRTFADFLSDGAPWLSPAAWDNAASSRLLRTLWSRGYTWADPQYLFFDEFDVDENYLDETLARAESLKSNFRMRPEFPIFLATPELYIALDSAGLLVRAWVGNEQTGLVVSFDPSSFDLFYRQGDSDAMFAMGAALNWFIDCVTVLDGQHFQRLGSFTTGEVTRETTANNWWTSNSKFKEHIQGVREGTVVRPPAAHRVRGHVRRLNDMTPTDEARDNAPSYIRRNMGPNDTFVRAHSRGGGEATDRLLARIKDGSSLADYLAMAPRSG